MTHSVRVWAAAFAVAYAASLTTVSTQSPPQHAAATSLRVCGDPDNLPYSNDKLQGFENRIASVIAADLGVEASYTWWPHQRGLVKNTLEAGTCDVIFGVPHDLETMLPTKPYYTLVVRHRASQGQRHAVTSLDAPELKTLRIGVYANTPVEESLGAARPGRSPDGVFPVLRSAAGDRDRPAKLLDDLVAGTVDVAIPWGPLAGYYAKKLNAPIEMSRRCPSEDGRPALLQHQHGREEGQSRSEEPARSGDRSPPDARFGRSSRNTACRSWPRQHGRSGGPCQEPPEAPAPAPGAKAGTQAGASSRRSRNESVHRTKRTASRLGRSSTSRSAARAATAAVAAAAWRPR